ncbi:hypothetical protein [Anaplasma marginale]|nr:hypothetical protein [Anaplasma marginale]
MPVGVPPLAVDAASPPPVVLPLVAVGADAAAVGLCPGEVADCAGVLGVP